MKFYPAGTRSARFTFSMELRDPGPNSCGATPTAVCSDTIALADFLAGDVASSSVAVGNAERTVTVNGLSFFGADQWQVTRKLNINYGLRWEYFGPLHNNSQDLVVFVPGRGLLTQGNGISTASSRRISNNFAPFRFGFAFQPTAKNDLVVRGGIGVFYEPNQHEPVPWTTARQTMRLMDCKTTRRVRKPVLTLLDTNLRSERDRWLQTQLGRRSNAARSCPCRDRQPRGSQSNQFDLFWSQHLRNW